MRASSRYRQNLAELEALIQFGSSRAVWEIAYLTRKKAVGLLNEREALQLNCMTQFHESPDVLRLTRLKLQAEVEGLDTLNVDDARDLDTLLRNPYCRKDRDMAALELFVSTPTLAR